MCRGVEGNGGGGWGVGESAVFFKKQKGRGVGESVDGSEHPERVCICAESTSKLHRKENLEKSWTGVEKKTYGLEKIAILLEIKIQSYSRSLPL